MNARRSVPKALIGLVGRRRDRRVRLWQRGRQRHRRARPPARRRPRPRPPQAPSPSIVNITPAPIAAGPGPNGGTVVRWFIGLGAGTQPAQIGPEQAFITAYNASQKDVYIQYEIVDNTQASNILKTEIAAGNAPDIIGPVGVEGLNLFQDQLLDLKPLIDSTGYKATGVDQSLVDFFNSLGQNGATVGLPFAVYPSFIFYNKDLFDEAGLPTPPTKVGDLYDGKPWDLDALRTLAMKLTVDKNGKDATQAGFDPANIVQWGFESQYMDNYNLRAESAFFGAGALQDSSRQGRHPGLHGPGGQVVERRRLEGSLHPDRQPGHAATCSAVATSSAPETWRSTRGTPGSPAASPRPRPRSRSSSASPSSPPSTARPRRRSMPIPSAS